MSELTPHQTAEALRVSAQTLRRWSVQFSEFLSQDAKPGRGRRRMYTVDDLALLRRASDLLRAHSVDETIALLRVTPDAADTRALETMTVTDLIAESKTLRDVVSQMRGDVAALTDRVTTQQAELDDMRAQLAQLQARRSWWQRFTRQ